MCQTMLGYRGSTWNAIKSSSEYLIFKKKYIYYCTRHIAKVFPFTSDTFISCSCHFLQEFWKRSLTSVLSGLSWLPQCRESVQNVDLSHLFWFLWKSRKWHSARPMSQANEERSSIFTSLPAHWMAFAAAIKTQKRTSRTDSESGKNCSINVFAAKGSILKGVDCNCVFHWNIF